MVDKMLRVLYVTPSSFTSLNAGALRNAMLANALAQGRNEVTVLTADSQTDVMDSGWARILHPGVAIVPGGIQGRWGRTATRLVLGIRPPDRILCQTFDSIILYNPGPAGFGRFRRLASRLDASLTVDVSEWLGPTDLPGGVWSPYTWLYEAFMRVLPRRVASVIAISGPMADRMGIGGASVLVVPPLSCTVQKTPDGLDPDPGTQAILVSGSALGPKGKDSLALDVLAEIARELPDVLRPFRFEIAGTLDDLDRRATRLIGSCSEVREHGWVDWYEATRLVRECDWLFLLRDHAVRRNRLGLSSKATESLAAGTPVIVNAGSGLDDYVQDGRNGLVAERPTAACVATVLARASAGRLRPDPDITLRPDAWTERISSFLIAAGSSREPGRGTSRSS